MIEKFRDKILTLNTNYFNYFAGILFGSKNCFKNLYLNNGTWLIVFRLRLFQS